VINNPGGGTATSVKGQLTVSAADVECGSIFGDDFLRKKNRYSYTAVSLDRSNILFVPKNIAMECLDSQSIQALSEMNYNLYQDDVSLLLRREQLIRSKLIVDNNGRTKQSGGLTLQQQQQLLANRLSMASVSTDSNSSSTSTGTANSSSTNNSSTRQQRLQGVPENATNGSAKVRSRASSKAATSSTASHGNHSNTVKLSPIMDAPVTSPSVSGKMTGSGRFPMDSVSESELDHLSSISEGTPHKIMLPPISPQQVSPIASTK
jgi:hypothetical protein